MTIWYVHYNIFQCGWYMIHEYTVIYIMWYMAYDMTFHLQAIMVYIYIRMYTSYESGTDHNMKSNTYIYICMHQ